MRSVHRATATIEGDGWVIPEGWLVRIAWCEPRTTVVVFHSLYPTPRILHPDAIIGHDWWIAVYGPEIIPHLCRELQRHLPALHRSDRVVRWVRQAVADEALAQSQRSSLRLVG